MAVVVSVHAVVEELEALTEESTAYLNRKTGALYALQDEDARLIEDGGDLKDLPEWQHDELPKIRQVLESEEWLPLPTRFDIHEWAIMDQFARSVDDAAPRDELLTAIRGAGAFRTFRNAVHRHRIHEDWYRFRTTALARIAIEWLDDHGIAYVEDETASPPV
jgi:Uncharacterised protein family (UPF0158)